MRLVKQSRQQKAAFQYLLNCGRRNARKLISLVSCLTLAVAGLSGCGFNTEAGSYLSQEADANTLNVMIWDSDLSETTVQEFESQFNCKVNVTYLEDTNEMLQKLIAGGADYDVLDVESDYVRAFKEADLLAPLDYGVITNTGNLDPTFFTPGKGAIGDENFEYSIPLAGPFFTCVVYNKNTCPGEIDTLEDLAKSEFKGEVCSVKDSVSVYIGGLIALGYPLDSTDDDELAECQEMWQKIYPNVKSFVSSSAVSQLETGECSVAYCWDFNTICADSEKYWDEFDVAPATGMGYTQDWCIAKSSRRQELANEFINFTMSPEQQANLINDFGGITTVKKELIEDLLPEYYYENPCVIRYTEMWKDHQEFAVTDEQNDKMDDLYNELMSQ